MKSKIRFGIIGCSSIAIKSAIPSIIDGKFSTLEMIGSRDIKKSKKIAKKFSCLEYGSYDQVLKNNNIDAVYISLPIKLHEKWICRAAKAGKHVLCEKSAVLSENSARKVIQVCKDNNVRIMENFVFKFHPQHKKIFELIEKKSIGKIHTIDAKFGFNIKYNKNNFRFSKKLGGGALNDIGTYLISTSKFIYKEVPHSIFCNLEIDKKTKIDTRGNILLSFSNNKSALLSFGYNNYFQSTYNIWGTKGMIKSERAFNVNKNMETEISIYQNDKIKKLKLAPKNQFQIAVDKFCSEIQNGINKINFEQDLLEQAIILDAVKRSAKKKSQIRIKI